MRARWLSSLLLLCACGAPPGPTPASSRPGEPAPAPAAPASEPGSAEAQREERLEALLPLSPDRVCWYRSSEPGRPARRLAMFLVRDPQRGAWWATLGPGAGPGGLCLWRSRFAVWVFPGSFSRPGAFRAWTGEPTWDDERGREAGQEELETRAGRFTCLRTDYGRADRTLRRVWLAEGVGLIAMEWCSRGTTLRRLELDEVAPRGPPARYRRDTPDELWASVNEATLRLDAAGIELLLGPELLRRARHPSPSEAGRDDPLRAPRARPPEEPDPDAARIEAILTDLVALAPRRAGPWRVEGPEARAEGELLRGGRRVACELVLRASPAGWRWDDLVVPAE